MAKPVKQIATKPNKRGSFKLPRSKGTAKPPAKKPYRRDM